MSASIIQVHINWNGILESVSLPRCATVSKVGSALKSAAQFEDSHKIFIFKGLLLPPE